MAFPIFPVLAGVAAFALLRRKTPSKARSIVVIQGATAGDVMLEIGDRLSIQFLESPGEEWKMTDEPDGFLLGSAKLKWEKEPGERKLKSFDFESKRKGTTSAEFIKYVEGQDPKGVELRQIKIFIEESQG